MTHDLPAELAALRAAGCPVFAGIVESEERRLYGA